MGVGGSMHRGDLVPEDIVLVMDGTCVEGTIHFEPGKNRFSDAWESALRERRAFLPVSAAAIRRIGEEAKMETDFILVDKADVRVVYPRATADGSIPTRRLDRRTIRATIVLETLVIRGTIHLDPLRSRFSEAWEAMIKDSRSTIPVTDATITDVHGEHEIATTDYLSVEKSEVVAAFPENEEGPPGMPTRRIDVQPLRTVVLMEGVRAEGTVHAPPGQPNFSRFSDLWDQLIRDPRTFVPMTETAIMTSDGHTRIGEAHFVVIEKDRIRGAYPLSSSD